MSIVTEIVTSCPVCSGRSVHHVEIAKDLIYGAAGEFGVRRCLKCRLFFLSPRPQEHSMPAFYPDAYPAYQDPARRSSRLRRLLSAGVSAFRTLAAGPYIIRYGRRSLFPTAMGDVVALDVGAGTGPLAAKLERLGWSTVSVEPSAHAVRIARDRVRGPVVEGDIHAAELDGMRFDLVTMMHVLEHLHDPVRALKKVREHLKPEGRLVIEVPNGESFEARGFGPRWIGWDVPRHICTFTTQSLEYALREAGYRILCTRPAWFPDSIAQSMLLTVDSWLGSRLVGRHMVLRTLVHVVSPIAALSYVLGNRGVLQVVAVAEDN